MTTHKDPSTITTISTTHLLCRAALVIITPLIAIWQNANPENRLIDLNLSIFSESSFPVSTLIAVLILTALLLLSKIVSSLVRRWLERYYINHDGSNIDGIQLAFHHFIRDSGLFDGLMNVLSLSNVAHLLRNHPKVIWQSLQLYWRMSVVKYGSSSSQNIEVFLPHKYQVTQPKQSSNRLIFFVHGGAWGSGSPSMYRLIALPFLEMNWAVAILGYRTYPEGDASTQVHDVELALAELSQQYPDICSGHVCCMGHSSGAHIVLLTVVERIRRLLALERSGNERLKEEWKCTRLPIHSIIGLSGPYNITHHFDFEAGRGVEQISPMKPANGNSHDMFPRYSPAEQLSKIYGQCTQKEQQLVKGWFPQVTLFHGTNDGTVPHFSTQEAVRVLRSSGVPHCKELLAENVGHEECVMQIMLGGLVRDSLTQLLSELCQKHQ